MLVKPSQRRFAFAAVMSLAAVCLACETRSVTLTGIISNPAGGLSDLLPSTGALSPAFDPKVLSYQLVVDVNTPTIFFVPTATGGAQITVNGFLTQSGQASQPISLDIGVNTVTIVAGSADGLSSVTYTVTVTRTST